MKWVHLVNIGLEGGKPTPVTVATVVLDADAVRVEGDSLTAKHLREIGVPKPGEQAMLTVADGQAFMDALPAFYRNPQLFATGVQEGDAVTPYSIPPMKKVA